MLSATFFVVLCINLAPVADSAILENPDLSLSPDATGQQSGFNEIATDTEQSGQSFLAIEPTSSGRWSLPSYRKAELPVLEDSGSKSEPSSGQETRAANPWEIRAANPWDVKLELPSGQAQSPNRKHTRDEPSWNAPPHQVDLSSTGAAEIVRPGAGTGAAEIVRFGLFAKSFFGANLKENEFKLDAVMLLKWKDSRAVDMVPSGMNEVTMSGIQAMSSIWMPEVVVTNRGIGSYELISTSVTIARTGDVTKVERAVVVCSKLYDLEEYPFDTQKLGVKVASSKYMLDEIVLEPDEDASSSGVREGFFKGSPYELDSWKVFVFEEADGALKKSRGILEIGAKRTFSSYEESHLMPTMLFLVIPCGVFWLPLQDQFIMVRFTLPILAMLGFTYLMAKSAGELPDGSPRNWNDILNHQILTIMLCAMGLNVLTEVCRHQFGIPALAEVMNNEAKVVLPVLSVIVLTVVLTAGAFKWLSVAFAAIAIKVLIGLVMAIYIGCSMTSVSEARAMQEYNDEQRRVESDRRAAESLERLKLATPMAPEVAGSASDRRAAEELEKLKKTRSTPPEVAGGV